MATLSRKRNSAARTLSPLVPLGVALLHGALATPSTTISGRMTPQGHDRAHELAMNAAKAVTHHCENISDSQTCHKTYLEGCTDSNKPNTYDAYLSNLKNLLPPPDEAQPVQTLASLEDFQSLDEKTIALGLGKQKQTAFAASLADIGQGNIYQAVGYLYYAIPGGVETCNCKLKSIEDKDFHIGLGFDPKIAKAIMDNQINNRGSDIDPVVQQTSVIVEMTPFYRSMFHPKWTLPNVQQLEGRQVKVVGQLIVDNEHNTADQNCAFEDHGEECWRGSAWELHPVTAVYICSAADGCATESTGWVPFDMWKN